MNSKIASGTFLALYSCRMRQLTLIREKKYTKQKVARSISLRGANHVVLKARAPMLRRSIPRIRTLIRETQDRFGVRIQALAIMPDHIHLVLKVTRRRQFADSLRFLAGMLAKTIARGRVWRARAWSRPLRWGRDLRNAFLYVWRNPFKAGINGIEDSAYLLDGVLQP